MTLAQTKRVRYEANERLDLNDKLAEDTLLDATLGQYFKGMLADNDTAAARGRIFQGWRTTTLVGQIGGNFNLEAVKSFALDENGFPLILDGTSSLALAITANTVNYFHAFFDEVESDLDNRRFFSGGSEISNSVNTRFTRSTNIFKTTTAGAVAFANFATIEPSSGNSAIPLFALVVDGGGQVTEIHDFRPMWAPLMTGVGGSEYSGAGNEGNKFPEVAHDFTPTTNLATVGVINTHTAMVALADRIEQLKGGTRRWFEDGIETLPLSTESDTLWSKVTYTRSRVGPAVVVINDILGELEFLGFDGTSQVHGAHIQAIVEQTPAAGRVPSLLSFITMDSSGTLAERMRVDSFGQVVFTPTSVTTANLAVIASGGTGADVAVSYLDTPSDRRWDVRLQAVADILTISNGAQSGGFSGQTNRIDIDGITGNIGFNTAIPAALLDLTRAGNGTSLLRFTTDDPWIVQQEGSGAGADLRLRNIAGTSRLLVDTDDRTQFRSSDGTTRHSMTVNHSNSRVGIGSVSSAASPVATLNMVDILTSGSGVRLLMQNTSGATASNVIVDLIGDALGVITRSQLASDGLGTGPMGTKSGFIGMVSNHPFGFIINDIEVARFDTLGQLGINTTPSETLHVSGTALFTGNTRVGGMLSIGPDTDTRLVEFTGNLDVISEAAEVFINANFGGGAGSTQDIVFTESSVTFLSFRPATDEARVNSPNILSLRADENATGVSLITFKFNGVTHGFIETRSDGIDRVSFPATRILGEEGTPQTVSGGGLTLTLGNGNFFVVSTSAAATVTNITITGWTSGSVIRIMKGATASVLNFDGTGTGDGNLDTAAITLAQGEVIGFILHDDTGGSGDFVWRRINIPA